jgi:AcrR family transcriptional regulator
MNASTKKPTGAYHHGDLRGALIRETERMIAADEFDRVTLNELGRRLGVARSAPYRHFSGKNELLCEVAERAFERMRRQWHCIRTDESRPLLERMRTVMRAYFELALAHRDQYRLMYREALVGDNETPALAASREAVFAELVRLLLDCQAEGLIAPGDPEVQLLFCWAPLHGMASFVIDQHVPADLFESMLEWTVESVLRGLGAAEGG